MTKHARKRPAPKGQDQFTVTAGLVDWLLACPEKDWFVPLRSESTRSIRKLPHT